MPKRGSRRSLPQQQQQLLKPQPHHVDTSGQKYGIQQHQKADDKFSAEKPVVIGQCTSKELDGLAAWWQHGEQNLRSTATTSRPQLQQPQQQQAQQQQAEQFYIGDVGAADEAFEADSDCFNQARRTVSAPASIFGFGDDVYTFESMDSDMLFDGDPTSAAIGSLAHDGFDSGYSNQVSKSMDHRMAGKLSWADLQEEKHDSLRHGTDSDSGYFNKVSMYSDLESTFQDQASMYKDQGGRGASRRPVGADGSGHATALHAHAGYDSSFSDQVSMYQDQFCPGAPSGGASIWQGDHDSGYGGKVSSYSDKVSKYKDQASGEPLDSSAIGGYDSGYSDKVSRYSDNVGRGVLGGHASLLGESSDYFEAGAADSDFSDQVSTYQNVHNYIIGNGRGGAVDDSYRDFDDSDDDDKQANSHDQVSYKSKLVPRADTHPDDSLPLGSVAYVDTKGGIFDSGFTVKVSKFKDQAVQTDSVDGGLDSGYTNQVSKYKDKAVQADSPGAYIDMSFQGLESVGTARPAPSTRRPGDLNSDATFGAKILNQMSMYQDHGRFMADYSRASRVMLMSSIWRHIEYALHEPGGQSAVRIFKDLAWQMSYTAEMEGDMDGALEIRQLAALVEIRAANRIYSKYGDKPRRATSSTELGGSGGGSSSSSTSRR